MLAATSLLPAQTLPNNTGSSKYVVFAWNDLGMHCLNPTYDQAVILPPYNTIQAQVVQRGNPPLIVTSGVNVSYSILGNTTSANKGKYGQFWTNALKLFGVSPAVDHGLNLDDPGISNGLSGSMIAKGSRFVASGVPLTPVNDAGVWNPYQTGVITVKDATGATVASTRIVVPTSDEINCAKCHGASDPLGDILRKHDAKHQTTLVSSAPVLCASCHGSPVLNQATRGSAGTYLSEAIHGSHATRGAACYDCHPGASTKCNRSLAHTDAAGACTNCHGSMANVAATSMTKGRTPWLNEPGCSQCHTNVPGVDTGAVLYRNAAGHGSMACSACHNSPHAMLPSSQPMDSYSAAKYQGTTRAQKAIGSCGACHSSNHGEGFSEWYSEHGASGTSTQSACNVCHTGFQNPVQANFPHGFQWNERTSVVGSGPVKNVPVVETPLPNPAIAPAITSQPASQTVLAGTPATFSVQATGTAPLAYQWRRNGTAIASATGASYTTPATVAGDSGATFTVVVSNAAGSVTSHAATLTVTAGVAPRIVSQPVSLRLRAGQTAVFSVVASGTTPLSYKWYKNGSVVSGATSPTYSFAVARSDNDASIYVVVSNPYGSVKSSTVRLRVRN